MFETRETSNFDEFLAHFFPYILIRFPLFNAMIDIYFNENRYYRFHDSRDLFSITARRGFFLSCRKYTAWALR